MVVAAVLWLASEPVTAPTLNTEADNAAVQKTWEQHDAQVAKGMQMAGTAVAIPSTIISTASAANRNNGGKVQKETIGRKGALNEVKRDIGIPRSQQPEKVVDPKTGKEGQYIKVPMRDSNGKQVLDKNGRPITTREYTYKTKDGNKIVQDHSAGHKFNEGGKGDQGSHFNVRPPNDTRTGKVDGTKPHYNYDNRPPTVQPNFNPPQ